MSESTDLVNAVMEIRDLLRLMAEPQIAARDQKHRDEVSRLVGKSELRAKAVFLMDGAHTQTMIHAQTGFDRGNLSTFIKELSKAGLLTEDAKQPKLTISIPSDFFDKKQKRE